MNLTNHVAPFEVDNIQYLRGHYPFLGKERNYTELYDRVCCLSVLFL